MTDADRFMFAGIMFSQLIVQIGILLHVSGVL